MFADPEVEMEYCCGENEEVDLDLLMNRCQKDPKHYGFIHIMDFSLNHLSHVYSDSLPKETLKNIIIDHAVRTARIRVLKEHPHINLRTLKKFGSAYLMTDIYDQATGQSHISSIPCPLANCSIPGPHQVLGPLYCLTAKHVFEDESEARCTEVDFFFDDPNDSSSKIVAHCVEITMGEEKSKNISRHVDAAFFQCVIHDLDFVTKLKERKIYLSNVFDQNSAASTATHSNIFSKRRKLITNVFKEEQANPNGEKSSMKEENKDMKDFAICISHLHGKSKHISIGTSKKTKLLDWTRFATPLIIAMEEFGDEELFFKELNEAVSQEDFKKNISEIFNSPEIEPILSALGIGKDISNLDETTSILGRLVPLFFGGNKAWKKQIHKFEDLCRSIIPKRKKNSASRNNDTYEEKSHKKRQGKFKRMSSQNERIDLNEKINGLIQTVFRGICERSGIPSFDILPLNNAEYTVSTCPGSSGARVLCINQQQQGYTLTWHTHKSSHKKKRVNVGGLGVAQLVRVNEILNSPTTEPILAALGLGSIKTADPSERNICDPKFPASESDSRQPDEFDLD